MKPLNIVAVFATLLVFGFMGCKKDEAATEPTSSPTQSSTPTPSSYKGATVANVMAIVRTNSRQTLHVVGDITVDAIAAMCCSGTLVRIEER